MAMNGCTNSRINVARLYLPRREGGIGLIGNKGYVEREKKAPDEYIYSREYRVDTESQ